MLGPQEKYAFDGMVNQLRADQRFARRIDRLTRPRRPWHVFVATLLLAAAPLIIVAGGWTGLLVAMAGCGYGAHLMTRPAGWQTPRQRSSSWLWWLPARP
ncbi:hypothetical protein AB0M20_17095 [Actinoplanes sp. NPDC051633]|uniref:hypothetical protein n=1 Tax=Actinoplanes sp. NPDC051633 TaxID=3155670 RepID=UPI003418433A